MLYKTNTDLHAAHNEMLSASDALLEELPVAVAVIDRDLRFLRVNSRCAEINGVSVDDHINRPVREVIPQLADTVEGLCRRVLDGETVDIDICGETPKEPGVRRWWSTHYFPLDDRAGPGAAIGIGAVEITDRKNMESSLLRAQRRLESKISLIQTFANAIAHDVRSPIATAHAELELLRDRLAGDPESVAAVNHTLSVLRSTARMTDGLVRLASIRSIDSAEIVDLGPIVRRVIANLGAIISVTGASVTIEGDLPTVAGDETLLLDLFQNVIENAIKYRSHDRASEIRVSARRVGSANTVEIRDNGTGIPPELSGHLFHPGAKSRESKGAGLGLVIAQRVVVLHGARLTITPNVPRGTCVGIEFPEVRPGQLGRPIVPSHVRGSASAYHDLQ